MLVQRAKNEAASHNLIPIRGRKPGTRISGYSLSMRHDFHGQTTNGLASLRQKMAQRVQNKASKNPSR